MPLTAPTAASARSASSARIRPRPRSAPWSSARSWTARGHHTPGGPAFEDETADGVAVDRRAGGGRLRHDESIAGRARVHTELDQLAHRVSRAHAAQIRYG